MLHYVICNSSYTYESHVDQYVHVCILMNDWRGDSILINVLVYIHVFISISHVDQYVHVCTLTNDWRGDSIHYVY